MYAAAEGKSNLGIPKKVGEEFVAADADGRIAAGIVFTAPDGDVLLLRRSSTEQNFPGHWSLPGGKGEAGESAEQVARREATEEIGEHPDGKLDLIDQRTTPTGMQFHTFRQPVETKFIPKLNDEHSGYAWAPRDMLPEPLHPAVKDVLSKKLAADHLAFDKASVRTKDADGHLHIEQSNISRACVNPYLGEEIPDWESLGLDPQRIYNLLRDPKELEKSASTFDGKPLLFKHKPTTASDHQGDITVGAVSNVFFEAPFLKAKLDVWPGEAIEAIESGSQKELSCGYRYVADMTPGTYEGEKYDGVMRDIVGNHVALVREGRAGPAVVVGDSAIPKLQEIFDMSKSALLSRKAAMTHGAMMFYLRPKLAKDAKIDLTPILTGITTKNFGEKKSAIVKGVTDLTNGKLAKDASIEDVAKLLDSLDGVEPAEAKDEEVMDDPDDAGAVDADPINGLRKYLSDCGMNADEVEKACEMMKPKAADETPEEKEAREKKEKEAADKGATDNEPKDKDMVSKPAMDSAIKTAVDAATKRAEDATMKRLADIRIAERAVEPLIGKPAVALDSASAIYAAALKAHEVKTEGVDPSAYPAMVDMLVKNKASTRSSQQHQQAQDEASVTDRQAFEKTHGIAPRRVRNLG